jgi:hypothetical protein
MNLTKRITAYICISLGALIYLFFKYYNGELIPYPFLFWLFGIGLALFGLYLLSISSSVKKFKTDNTIKQQIEDLKLKGEKISVDLNAVEIKRNDYFEEPDQGNTTLTEDLLLPNYRSKIDLLDDLYGEPRKSEQVEIDQAVLIFKQIKNGKEERFLSSIIHKDKETLLFRLMAQKTTTLYVDRENRSKYYFDIGFLFP